MKLFREFFKVIGKLNDAQLAYAVIGGVALAFHATPRLTKDIDILGVAEDHEKFEAVFKTLGYVKSALPIPLDDPGLVLHRFIKASEDPGGDLMVMDLLLGEKSIYRDIIERAQTDESHAGKVRVAAKPDLITLKKARNSKQDQADIEQLERQG